MLEVSGLLTIMNQQSNLITELKDLVNQQLLALQQDDLDKITFLTGQQEYISRKIAELEQQRQQLIENYAGRLGIEIKHLSDLQPNVSSRDWDQIQSLKDAIIERSQAIQQTNDLNALLLKQGLQYTEKMLHVLHPSPPSVYGKSGDLSPGGKRAIVDTNV